MQFYKNLVKVFIILVGIISTTNTYSQDKKYTKEEYIAKFKPIAIQQMKRSGVPASIIMAQACLESSYGNSTLTRKGKNHFGIKCHSSWTGEKMYYDDDAKGECFRVYKTDEESFKNHSDFLRYNKRYASLFDLDPNDYKAWANGLKKAGYATNPQYPQLLIKTIESNNLHVYGEGVGGKIKPEALPLSPSKLEAIDLENFVIQLNRRIYKRNGVKYVVANGNDTYEDIAKEFKLTKRQLLRYNDIDKNDKIYSGQELYIKAKKTRASKDYPMHIVQEGETIHSISQLYAIKENSLMHYNDIKQKKKLETDSELFLRNKMRR